MDDQHTCARESGDLDDTDVTHAPEGAIAYELAVHGVPISLASHAVAQLDAVLALAQVQTPGLTLSDLIADVRRVEADA